MDFYLLCSSLQYLFSRFLTSACPTPLLSNYLFGGFYYCLFVRHVDDQILYHLTANFSLIHISLELQFRSPTEYYD